MKQAAINPTACCLLRLLEQITGLIFQCVEGIAYFAGIARKEGFNLSAHTTGQFVFNKRNYCFHC